MTAALERAHRDERAAVLATITRGWTATSRSPRTPSRTRSSPRPSRGTAAGSPDRPGAWLTTTAWRRALDRRRHERMARKHLHRLAEPMSYHLDPELQRSSLEDDRLRMLFCCCHPALSPEARMALTLRSVAGLTVPEIARAFLSTETAMERRLVRARRKVSDARIPFAVPPGERLTERLAGVLRVVYLVFTENHAAPRGEARRSAAGCATRRSGWRACSSP